MVLVRPLHAVAFVLTFVFAACATSTISTPTPLRAPSSTACPSVATAKALVDAWDRADGAAAAALFTSDGTIEGPAFSRVSGTGVGRWKGAAEISKLVTDSSRTSRAVELSDGPSGCDTVVTWGQRFLSVNITSPLDLRATATLRDGKIASIVYIEVPR